MGKLKATSISSDPAFEKAELKNNDLAGQLLMQLFYGKNFSLPLAPMEVDDSTEVKTDENGVEDLQENVDNITFEVYDDYEQDYDDYEPDYYDELDELDEQYHFELTGQSSKRQTSSLDTNYYANKLRSKGKWKQEKVNPDRFQNACRVRANEYRVNVYQANDIANRKDSVSTATYRTINYYGGGSSSESSGKTTSSKIVRVNRTNNAPANYNENDALQRALQESQQEHLLRTTASTTGLSLNQLRDLQNREFSPEDYEMLLLLDKQIAPKCLTLTQVRSLPCKVLCSDDLIPLNDKPCMVCLCEFENNERIRTLPCSHIFHDECVTQWLTGSSTVCPTCKSAVC